MKKITKKKLKLAAATIRKLSPIDMRNAVGGCPYDSLTGTEAAPTLKCP